jgi:hypothetical protein
MKTHPNLTFFGRHVWHVAGAIAGLVATPCLHGCSSTESGDANTGGTASTAAGGTSAVGGSFNSNGGATTSKTTGKTSTTGGSTSSGGTTSTSTTKPAPVGLFGVYLHVEESYTTMVGGVRDKAEPEARVWTVTQSAGECQLLKPSSPFCDPACDATETCTAGGVCQSAAVAHSVGTVTVSGVKTAAGESEFSEEPNSTNAYVFGTSLAYPPFGAGDTVRLSTKGGDYAAFTLEAKAFDPLKTTLTEVKLESGKATALTWTAGTADSNIDVLVDISHHGGIKGKIVCSAADDGSLEIPANLVTALVNLGIAGFPTVTLSRQSYGSAELAHGRVDLFLNAPIELPVVIPGVTSCNTDDDCESGKTCSSIYLCQ